MIITLDMSQGFLPTKVTFQVNLPGCVRVGYHNVDIFEPGRVNTFRQYQQWSDLNSELLPMCTCLKPEIQKFGICTDTLPFYTPPKYLGLTGFSIRELFSSYINLCISVMPDETIYHDYVVAGLAQASKNLGEELNWDGPHLWGLRTQGDLEKHGLVAATPDCEFRLIIGDSPFADIPGTAALAAWSTSLRQDYAGGFPGILSLSFFMMGFPYIQLNYLSFHTYGEPLPLVSYLVDDSYAGYFGPPSLKPIFEQWLEDNAPSFIQLDEAA